MFESWFCPRTSALKVLRDVLVDSKVINSLLTVVTVDFQYIYVLVTCPSCVAFFLHLKPLLPFFCFISFFFFILCLRTCPFSDLTFRYRLLSRFCMFIFLVSFVVCPAYDLRKPSPICGHALYTVKKLDLTSDHRAQITSLDREVRKIKKGTFSSFEI